MKKQNLRIKATLCLMLAVVGLALSSHQSFAQTTITKWTFETSVPAGTPGAGNWITNIAAEVGTGTASAKHATAASYTTPAGNGSSHCFSANNWSAADFFQFATSTTGYTNISVSFDNNGSSTGPRDFSLYYSTDGVNFTQLAGSSYQVALNSGATAWSAGAPVSGTSYSFNLSSVTSLANAPIVYFRLVDADTTSIGGGTVGTSGTGRIDNFAVSGTIPGVPSIITQPQSTNVFFGDTATFTVSASGSAPLGYVWYTNSTPPTPLTDGSSGFGSGTISGSTSSTLTLTLVNTNQAGNYLVIVTNGISPAATSSVVHLTVTVRTAIVTNIAYLHTLHDANYVLTDTTNLYQVEGIVTTIGNLTSSGIGEVESFYLQDGTGGMDVFFRGGFPFPANGDDVTVIAPLGQFNGTLEDSPINGNPAHSIVINSHSNPLPAPQYFDFSTRPTAITMEETNEGRYMVVSNVFVGVTNADPHLVGNELVFMTNLTGQVFTMIVANNPALGPVGVTMPGTFATSVVGVMSQNQTSGTVLTNNYSIILSDFSQIQFSAGNNPPPIPLNITSVPPNVILTWGSSFFSLQSSTNVAGPYTTISSATNFYAEPFTNPATFYRLIH